MNEQQIRADQREKDEKEFKKPHGFICIKCKEPYERIAICIEKQIIRSC